MVRYERDQLEDPSVDGETILRWIYMKRDGGTNWIELTQDREKVVGSCEYGNEPSGSIKCGEFLD